MIAGAYVYLTRPVELRERVAADGLLESLQVLILSDIQDVKTMCSTSVRNLSQNASVQAKMVESGMLRLLIDVMSPKGEARRAAAQSGQAAAQKYTLLPNPVDGWEPGRPSHATAEVRNANARTSCMIFMF